MCSVSEPLVSPAQLSASCREKLDLQKAESAQRELLASRTALQSTLEERDAHRIELNGKQPTHPKAHISMSHCQGKGLAVSSSHVQVGCDIEVERPQLQRIAKKFIGPAEAERFSHLPSQQKLQFLWGIKESLFKLYGKGQLAFAEQLIVQSIEPHPTDTTFWGMAWIYPVDQAPMQCLFQCGQHEDVYWAVAMHRSSMAPFTSERLRLREWQPADARWLLDLNANPKVVQYTGDAGFSSIDAAKNLILEYPNYQRDGFGRWIVERLEDGMPIGWCGLKDNPWGVDLGYRFFEAHWGRGYATEAASRTLEKARELGVNNIVGRTMEGNVASIAVLEKIGMQFSRKIPFEASFVNHSSDQNKCTPEDQDADLVIYTLPNE